MKEIKQVIVARTDLNMRKGKLATQVAHASMKVFFDRMELRPAYMSKPTEEEANMGSKGFWNAPLLYFTHISNPMMKWMEGSFTKIVVGCNSEQELFELQKQAEEAGIVNAIIQDSGLTEFKEQCSSCMGLGANYSVIDSSTTITSSHICTICKGTGKVNKPTYTCLAIGPDYSDKINKITGHLKLL
jgi:PTH2 family peptidyl-tRNA hydrolase